MTRSLKKNGIALAVLECIASGSEEVLAGFINPRKTMAFGRDRVINDYFGRRPPSQIRRVVQGLEKRGSISSDGKYQITSQGWCDILMSRMREADLFDDMRLLIIIFDIPESRRIDRNRLRYLLKKSGCGSFQKSVYITPFDIVNDLKDILKKTGLEENVRMFYGETVH